MTAISKNVYFGVLDDIGNKYNNTVHRTIKMKPIDITDDSYVECNENLHKKILNLKLVIMLEFTKGIGQKKFLLLIKLKSFAVKTNLANSKTEADKLDIDKLEHIPVD